VLHVPARGQEPGLGQQQADEGEREHRGKEREYRQQAGAWPDARETAQLQLAAGLEQHDHQGERREEGRYRAELLPLHGFRHRTERDAGREQPEHVGDLRLPEHDFAEGRGQADARDRQQEERNRAI
jgi:hypothetical protein